MRIGISDGRIWENNHYLKLRAFGFDSFDFNMANTNALPYTYDDKEFEQYLKNQKRLADEAGITIWQTHGPWRGVSDDATEASRAEKFENMVRSIRGTAMLGAKYWVIHPMMPYGIQDIKASLEMQTREMNLEVMSRLLKVAKQEGVTICFENLPFTEFSLSSPAAIVDFIKEMNDPSFAMCLDTGHANVCRKWQSPAESVRAYSEYIKVFHIHDNRWNDEHLAPFFFGSIDWKDFASALREVNFDGVFSLECRPDPRLPADILDEMYSIYFRIAKYIVD